MTNLLASVIDTFQNFATNLSDGMGVWYLVLFNAFAVTAIFIKLFEYQLKGRRANIIFNVVAQGCWVIYFLLQGNIISASASLVGTTSSLIFLHRQKHKWANSIFWLYFFIAVSIIFGIIGFVKWYSIFALLAAIFGVITYFVKSPKAYRYFALVFTICWLVNSICNKFILALVSDTVCLVSILISIARMYWFKKEKLEDNKENDFKTIAKQGDR